jgi:hypothetical protein
MEAQLMVLLHKLGLSWSDYGSLVFLTMSTVAALKKSIGPMAGYWNVVGAFLVAGFLSAFSFWGEPALKIAGCMLLIGASASGFWQLSKDVVDRVRGQDTNLPESGMDRGPSKPGE